MPLLIGFELSPPHAGIRVPAVLLRARCDLGIRPRTVKWKMTEYAPTRNEPIRNLIGLER
jgi:hypothetical protein